MNDADQVDGPHLDDNGAALAGQLTGIDCDTKCLVDLAAIVSKAGEAIEGFRFTWFVAEGAGEYTGLLDEDA